MANPIDSESPEEALELIRQGACHCRDFLCRAVLDQAQEFFHHFQKVLLAQNFYIARQGVAPGPRCSLSAPLPVKKVGEYGRALDVFPGLVLGDGVFFVKAIRHQRFIEKMNVLLSQNQAKDEFQIVGVSQGCEGTDGFKDGSSDKQVRRRYQKVCAEQRKRNITLLPVKGQRAFVPGVGDRLAIVVQKRGPGCHYIDRRFRLNQGQTGCQAVWRKTIVRIEEGYKVAGGAQDAGIQRVMGALVGPGPENDFGVVLAQVAHHVGRTIG